MSGNGLYSALPAYSPYSPNGLKNSAGVIPNFTNISFAFAEEKTAAWGVMYLLMILLSWAVW